MQAMAEAEVTLTAQTADPLGNSRPARNQAARRRPARKEVSVSKPRYTPRRAGVKRTTELELAILERVAAGESLRKVCEAKGMPDPATVRYWAVTDLVFGERLKIARMVQAHEFVDRMTEELNRPPVRTKGGKVDHGEIQLRRLRIDTYKWILAKMLPKVCGDKLLQKEQAQG